MRSTPPWILSYPAHVNTRPWYSTGSVLQSRTYNILFDNKIAYTEPFKLNENFSTLILVISKLFYQVDNFTIKILKLISIVNYLINWKQHRYRIFLFINSDRSINYFLEETFKFDTLRVLKRI